MRRILGFAAITAVLALTGCNTIEGMGKDVSSVGKTVSKTAQDTK
ncbi:MAG: entericidin A/B family lipoprotein [Sphingomonas bacterium]